MPNPPAIVVRLIRATNNGRITWTQAGPTTYGCLLGSSEILIASRDGDGLAPYVLSVTPPDGNAVVMTGEADDREYNQAFKYLFDAASTSAIDSSPSVAQVLAELDRLEEPPF